VEQTAYFSMESRPMRQATTSELVKVRCVVQGISTQSIGVDEPSVAITVEMLCRFSFPTGKTLENKKMFRVDQVGLLSLVDHFD